MFRTAAATLLVAGLVLSSPASAGQFNKKINIGDAAPVWSSLPGVDGKMHSLADLKDKDVVVCVITCNHCPVAVAYEDRVISFAKKHAGDPNSKVAVVAINVNNLEADRLPKMKERAKEKGFNFPYLHDESQEIANKLGATRTPEFFVFNKERKLVYMGAMDDSQSSPKTHHLEAAVTATLKGQLPATKETRPAGCTIKFDKK